MMRTDMQERENFGAVCPSCRSAVDRAVEACPTCGWQLVESDNRAEGSSIVQSAVRPKKVQCKVEIACTVDRTGSSEPFQTGIPKTFEIVISQITAKAKNVTCWVQSHGDLDEGQEVILHTDGGTAEEAVEDIKKITYGGGGDPPEHHLDAIESLLDSVPWTLDPSRGRGAIVAFTTSDTKPAASGISAAELGKKIRAQGILLYLVCEETPELMQLAENAEGLVFHISNSPDPEELQKIAGQLAASIVATIATGGTVPIEVEGKDNQ